MNNSWINQQRMPQQMENNSFHAGGDIQIGNNTVGMAANASSQRQVPRGNMPGNMSMSMNFMPGMNNMNLIPTNNLNGNTNALSESYCSEVSPPSSHLMQGGQTNNNMMMNNAFVPSNNNKATGIPFNTMPMNGSMNHVGATVFKVKTGESMPPFLSMGQQKQQQQAAHPMTHNNNGHVRENNKEEMSKSLSEPMLNMMMQQHGMMLNGTMTIDDGARPPYCQQVGKGGTDSHSNNLFGLNGIMGDSNDTIGNSSSSGGASGYNRRNSEPAMNLLSELLDEPSAMRDKFNANGFMNMNFSSNMGNSNTGNSNTPDWPSPPIHDTANGVRKRSNSEPLVSENMLNDLDSLEPETVFCVQTGGALNNQLQRKDNFIAQDVSTTNEHEKVFNLHVQTGEPLNRLLERNGEFPGQFSNAPELPTTDGNNRTMSGRGKVKRSRSVDPMEMFRRVDGDLGNDRFIDSANRPANVGGHDSNGTKGLSEEESMGLYSREKPKRRRSAPLLSDDLFREEGLEGVQNENFDFAQMNLNFAPSGQSDAPQENKNNINFIQMLLGVENGNGPDGRSTSQTIHAKAEQLLSMNQSTVASMQQQPSHSGSIAQASHKQISEPMHQMIPMASAQQPEQQNLSNNVQLSTDIPRHDELPPNNGFMSNHNNIVNQGIFNSQHSGNLFAEPSSTNNDSSEAPPPLSIDNSEDLGLVLSAVKETQTNLQTLQSLVMGVGDPVAMEDLAAAFKLTASASQFVLSSDLHRAYSTLNDAWEKIRQLEDRLSHVQGPMQPQPFQSGGVMGHNNMMLPQAGLNQLGGGTGLSNAATMPNNPSAMGMSNPLQNLPIPPQPDDQMEPTTPTTAPKPKLDIEKPKVSPKSKSKPRKKKVSPPSSPVEIAVELEELPPPNQTDPEVIMRRLKGLMDRTQVSQKRLQKWDKKNGLPKSHSQTMVNSSRSRMQLQKGVILKKWNGDPLITPAEGGEATSEEQPEQDNSSQEESIEKRKKEETEKEVMDVKDDSDMSASATPPEK